jgi:drug/metabolite transporter (DMT)-like permease
MVQVNPQLLIPLHMIIVMLFIVVFALLKKYEIENRNWFMLGMFFGSIIYAMLVFSSTIKESASLWEYLLKFLAAGFAGTYYIVILLFSAIISLMILVKEDSRLARYISKRKEKRILYIIVGMALVFSICDVYISLRCVETIPFFENFVKANPLCINNN